MRAFLRFVAAMVVIGLLGAAGAYVWAVSVPEIAAIDPPAPASFDRALVERGEELEMIGDCVICHTAPNGQELAGGLPLPTPFGVLYTTNITPDPVHGIGRWSEAAFVRAMREGLGRDGTHLYPAFPYDNFTKTTDEDLKALYAYLMTRPAVAKPNIPNELRFPFNIRPVLAGWKLLFLDTSPFQPDPALDTEQNHGKYLVESLGHCGACHSPRNMMGAVIASKPFGGGEAEGWHAPALGKASLSPVPWTRRAFENYLFDGWDENHSIASGPMTPITNHLYDANEDDVMAMAAYMASLTPTPDQAAVDAAVKKVAALDWVEGAPSGGQAAPTDPELIAGEAIFLAQCVKCHKSRIARTQPSSLAVTAAVNAPDARNFVHVVRDGIIPPKGARDRRMEAMRLTVNGDDMVKVAKYVRWRFTDLPPWPDVEGTVKAIESGTGH